MAAPFLYFDTLSPYTLALDIPLAPGDEIVMGGLKPEEHLQDRDEEGEREYREEGRDDIEEHTQRERALIGGGESPDE